VDEQGADAANASGLLRTIAESGRTVVAVDLRGMGRTKLVSTTSRTGTFVQIFDAETWASYSSWQLEAWRLLELCGTEHVESAGLSGTPVPLPAYVFVHFAGRNRICALEIGR